MKKNYFSNNKILSIIVGITSILVFTLNACAPTKAIQNKSGVQLWSENCQRCHNTPSPSTFSAESWETIGMHMQTRALLTTDERDKILEFLKTSR